jgi:hypothetical protein
LKGVYSVAFSSFHNLLLSLLEPHLSSTNLHIYSRLPPSSHIAVAACALLASMSESPRNPNPGLNGYQQDVMQTEVGALSLLVASQASAISAAFWPMNAIFDAHFVIWCISGVQHESISTVRCPCGKAATSWRVFGVAKFWQPNAFHPINQPPRPLSTRNFHNHIFNDMNITSLGRCLTEDRTYLS